MGVAQVSLLSLKDVYQANYNGYELVTIEDFRDLLEQIRIECQQKANISGVLNTRMAKERLNLLVTIMPSARYVLWKREENFITLADTIVSLQREFPWLQ